MIEDVVTAGWGAADRHLLRSELFCQHRVRSRLFVIDLLPPFSSGAELGVYSGLFASVLARQTKFKNVTFLDPWWMAFGEYYPNWGWYSTYGRIRTRVAYKAAKRRISRSGLPNRHVEIGFSYQWLETQPDASLDWVYLDSTHTYEGTKLELALLDKKLKADGLIVGDDWVGEPSHRDHGVALAVNEFVRERDFEIIMAGVAFQWAIRRTVRNRTADLPKLSQDPLLEELRRSGRVPWGAPSALTLGASFENGGDGRSK